MDSLNVLHWGFVVFVNMSNDGCYYWWFRGVVLDGDVIDRLYGHRM